MKKGKSKGTSFIGIVFIEEASDREIHLYYSEAEVDKSPIRIFWRFEWDCNIQGQGVYISILYEKQKNKLTEMFGRITLHSPL